MQLSCGRDGADSRTIYESCTFGRAVGSIVHTHCCVEPRLTERSFQPRLSFTGCKLCMFVGPLSTVDCRSVLALCWHHKIEKKQRLHSLFEHKNSDFTTISNE